jgi:hypothetical protein
MMVQRNSWIRKSNSFPGYTLGKRLMSMVEASNHLGWEVQEFRPGEGWASAIEEVVGYTDDDKAIVKPMIVSSRGLAEGLMSEIETMPRKYKELRVYEVVKFPVKS